MKKNKIKKSIKFFLEILVNISEWLYYYSLTIIRLIIVNVICFFLYENNLSYVFDYKLFILMIYFYVMYPVIKFVYYKMKIYLKEQNE
jgi:hypothetical protein